MPKLRFNPIASQDLKEIKEYLIEDSSDLTIANNIISNILSKALLLESMPYMGNSLKSKLNMPTDYRYLVAQSYLIFYKVEMEYVSIYRVIHSRRDFAKVLFADDMQ